MGTITNLGELWGPSIFVTVTGELLDPSSSSDDDGDQRRSSATVPKQRRLQADIQGGSLCVAAATERRFCVDLPMIKGVGLFDSVYLGDRLRIGQNINGGGALVVQVRMDIIVKQPRGRRS